MKLLATVRHMSAHVRKTDAVFTRKRAFIFSGAAGVIVIVIAGALLLLVRPSANKAVQSGVLGLSTSSGATSQASPAVSPTPTPAATPEPTLEAGATSAPVAATTSSTTTSSTTSASKPPAGPPACTTVARFATLQVGFVTYRQDQTVQATTTIVNQGPTCVLTNNTVSANYSSNGATVNTQTVAVTSSSTWAAGQTLSTTLNWNLENCSTTPCSAQPPGTYAIAVTWPGVNALKQSFSVVSALDCAASDIKVGMTGPTTAVSGTTVAIDGTLTNTSNHACTVSQATDLIIKDKNGKVVFGTGLGASSNSQVWGSGKTLTFPYSWQTGAAGTYEATFTDTTTGISVSLAIKLT